MKLKGSLFLSFVAFASAAVGLLSPPAPVGAALIIAWAITITGSMVCRAIEERGER